MQEALHAWPPSTRFSLMFAAAAVTLWHARNDRLFNNKQWYPTYIKLYVVQLLTLWKNRAQKIVDQDALAAWIQWLSPAYASLIPLPP